MQIQLRHRVEQLDSVRTVGNRHHVDILLRGDRRGGRGSASNQYPDSVLDRVDDQPNLLSGISLVHQDRHRRVYTDHEGPAQQSWKNDSISRLVRRRARQRYRQCV